MHDDQSLLPMHYTFLCRYYLGLVHMIPGQLIASGQLTDPGVNFASVHGLTPVTVHMGFRCPGATSRGGLPVVQHRVTRLAELTFRHVNRTQKLPRGKSSLRMLIVNVIIA